MGEKEFVDALEATIIKLGDSLALTTMTTRDMFAAFVAAGMCARSDDASNDCIAESAYDMAAEMLRFCAIWRIAQKDITTD